MTRVAIVSLSVFCVYFVRVTSYAQQVRNTEIEERLVKLAWDNSPATKSLVYRAEIARYGGTTGTVNRSWFDIFKFQGNLNEFNLNPDKFSRSQYYPRYNFTLQFAMSDFVTIPRNIRTRKLEAEMARLDIESARILLRSEVLKKFNHYNSVKTRLSIQRKLESEIAVNVEVARNKFNQGSVTYDVLTGLTERYYSLQLATRELEESLEEAKLDIEAMIGAKLSSVIDD